MSSICCAKNLYFYTLFLLFIPHLIDIYHILLYMYCIHALETVLCCFEKTNKTIAFVKVTHSVCKKLRKYIEPKLINI